MNSRLNNKGLVAYIAALLFMLSPICKANAESNNDDFGVWTSLNISKKLTDKLKFELEGELRTINGVSDTDRRSIGFSMNYDLLSWLKADIGYIYIASFNEQEKKIKEYIGDDEDGSPIHNYNIDHAYWEQRDRFNVSLTASWKIGRIKFSLRERLQYQYTHSELIYEDKYRFKDMSDPNDPFAAPIIEPEEDSPNGGSELKNAKRSTTLRSRLTAKWDIKKCKITPFASVELFTRTDDWKGHDKLRYRLGADYKIDKDNELSLYYMYQDNHASSSPAGHAVCVGYSFDL